MEYWPTKDSLTPAGLVRTLLVLGPLTMLCILTDQSYIPIVTRANAIYKQQQLNMDNSPKCKREPRSMYLMGYLFSVFT